MWRSRTRTTALRSGQKRRQLQQLQQLQDLLGHMLLALHRRCWKWCCFVGPCLPMTDWCDWVFKLQVKSIQRIPQDPLEIVPLLIATFRSIHLQIHLARRVPCQASAASTDMRSVGNSGSWGWIKSNCHTMFGGMKINQHQLVWCEPTHNIP